MFVLRNSLGISRIQGINRINISRRQFPFLLNRYCQRWFTFFTFKFGTYTIKDLPPFLNSSHKTLLFHRCFYHDSNEPSLSWICWNCGNRNKTPHDDNVKNNEFSSPRIFFCQKCNAVCDPDTHHIDKFNPQDIYRFFGLEQVQFHISETQLDARYKNIQRYLHPDKFINADDTNQRYSTYWSTLASYCYRELKDPLKRAHLVLQYKIQKKNNNNNMPILDDKQHNYGNDISDPELLTEILELNERIDEIQTMETAKEFYEEILRQYNEELQSMSDAFLKDDVIKAKESLQRCQMMFQVLQRINYWTP